MLSSDNGVRRWSLHVAAGSLVVLIAALELWAASSADPDFYFPDPFRPLVLYVLALGVVVILVRRPVLRLNLALALGVVPIAAILLKEMQLRHRDVQIAERFEISSDPLLRYRYRAGVPTPDVDERGTPVRITSDGRWDIERSRPKPPGTYRIVVLGDSVPNDPSVPMRERFPARVGAALSDLPAPVEAINVSCEGYNTIQEVRLLEKVGLAYDPDLVVVAYVLNDPFLQNGGYRRIGNSFFLFQLMPLLDKLVHANTCSVFEPFHDRYAFDLAVRAPLERLALLATIHRFDVLVATLPIVEDFSAPGCLAMYDRVLGVAREQGFGTVRVVDEFAGEDYHAFLKPNDRWDVTHPNAAGHARIATAIARRARELILERIARRPAPAPAGASSGDARRPESVRPGGFSSSRPGTTATRPQRGGAPR